VHLSPSGGHTFCECLCAGFKEQVDGGGAGVEEFVSEGVEDAVFSQRIAEQPRGKLGVTIDSDLGVVSFRAPSASLRLRGVTPVLLRAQKNSTPSLQSTLCDALKGSALCAHTVAAFGVAGARERASRVASSRDGSAASAAAALDRPPPSMSERDLPLMMCEGVLRAEERLCHEVRRDRFVSIGPSCVCHTCGTRLFTGDAVKYVGDIVVGVLLLLNFTAEMRVGAARCGSDSCRSLDDGADPQVWPDGSACAVYLTTCSTGVAHAVLYGVCVDTSTSGYPLLTALTRYREGLIAMDRCTAARGSLAPRLAA
jgi:hypothetical protein